MASIQKIQAGAARFVDQELVPAVSAGEKILVAGAAALLLSKMENFVQQYAAHPIVAAMGVYDMQNHDVDVDALYQAFAPQFGNEKLPIKVPVIGTIKIGKAEVDKLYQYIKEA